MSADPWLGLTPAERAEALARHHRAETLMLRAADATNPIFAGQHMADVSMALVLLLHRTIVGYLPADAQAKPLRDVAKAFTDLADIRERHQSEDMNRL